MKTFFNNESKFFKMCREAKTEFVIEDVSCVQATLGGQLQPLVADRSSAEMGRTAMGNAGNFWGCLDQRAGFGSDEKRVYFENCFGLKMDLFLNLLMNQTHAMRK